MNTPPILFIEVALLRLGKEIVDGLDLKERTKMVDQIVNHWYERKEIDDEVRNQLFKCWQELVLNDRELLIRRSEARYDTQDVHQEVRLLYIEYCECVGGCLDSLAIA